MPDNVFFSFKVQHFSKGGIHFVSESLVMEVIGIAYPVDLENNYSNQCH
jgi:hypothetical protein